MKVSILVHNINRAAHLDRCLCSVAAQRYRPLEVVILDAGSTDDSASVIARWSSIMKLSRIEVKFSTCPLKGVAASRNLAAGGATGDLLFVIDNDALFSSPDCIDRTVSLFRSHPRTALVSARILYRDSDDVDPFTWVYRRPRKQWARRQFRTFTFTGGGFCVRAGAFREAGGFWDHLQYSREEEDLALGLIDRGWEVVYLPEVTIRHFPDPHGRSSTLQRRYVELRNGLLVLRRRLPAPVALAAAAVRVVSMCMRIVFGEKCLPRELFQTVAAAKSEWRESHLQRRPVAWGTLVRYVLLHIPIPSRGDGYGQREKGGHSRVPV